MEPQDHTLQTDPIEQSLSLHTMSSMRSLIINPSTSQPTISSILQTLTRFLRLTCRNKLLHHHALKLLGDLASRHVSLSHLVFDSVRSLSLIPSESTRLAVESLEVLASISELNHSESYELDDGFFVSLCFGPSVSTRLWLLKNAVLRFRIRPSLLFTVFLGFTKDPYPYVRAASLDGLVGLSKHGVFQDSSLVKGCYNRAVQLLRDMEDCVRLYAVRTVASWGVMLAASDADMKTYWSNEVFAKLCSMARDMSMKVRVEAFKGLIKMEVVSEDLLLQSLSKRVSGNGKQRETCGQSPSEQYLVLATSVAGALVHGLEDEFFEVRKSACQSLCTLTILSVEFAQEALNLLMDMLNDDSVAVRLQALESMHHMAISGCLRIQEKHLHMFLGVLIDNIREVRYAGRKILKIVKLNNISLFKSSINGVLENLDVYQQDEADVFSAFSHLGRNHKKFVGFIIQEVFEEVEAAFEGNLEFNSARVAALLILSVSAPLSHRDIGSVPPIMFSYAVTLLGRIYCAFSDIMDRDSLLAYLSEKSRCMEYSATNINPEEGKQQLSLFEGDAPNFAGNKVIDSQIESHITREPKEVANHHAEQQQPVIKFINYILAKFPDMWPMIRSGFTNELLRALRCWKEELATMGFDSLGSYVNDALAFTLQYLRIIKLLVEVWEHLLPAKTLCTHAMGELEFKLRKLDRRVKELMSRFVGFSPEEELHVLELMLLTCALRLCKVEICCDILTLKRLNAIYLRVECLLQERSALPSNFVVELGKSLHESCSSFNGASCSSLPFEKCLNLFTLKLFMFRGTIKQLKAELSISNNDSENPLPFVSGLPLGIPCEITLHNISSENRLWLRISMDDGIMQYVFLDPNLFEGSREDKMFTFVAPFYRTPKASCLTLKVCIGLEWVFEAVPDQKFGGPKHDLVLLCTEKHVYLSQVNKD